MNSFKDEPLLFSEASNFDINSGNFLERLIFNNRLLITIAFLLFTIFFSWHAFHVNVNANFEKMLPMSHPYIKNYLENKSELPGLGNSVRIAIEATDGDIYNADYLDVVRQVTDTVSLIPGVDRLAIKSLWTPTVRWTEVTEEGYRGGSVMPDSYNGSDASIAGLKRNIAVAEIVGSVVGNDHRSSLVVVPLLEVDPTTGKPIDYAAFSAELESKVRSLQSDKVKIYIIGFAKLMGDLIDGVVQIAFYFLIAALVAAAMIFLYTRCIRSTLLVLMCSIFAVVWQTGIISALGYDLDPYSVLVPFLVFAIGVSHGVQKMNGILQDVGRGTHRYIAARFTFRRLFMAGVTALLADAVGFGVLTIIDIQAIRDLAINASIGVAVLVFSNLVLLPILLSYLGVSPAAAKRSLAAERSGELAVAHIGERRFSIWEWLSGLTERKNALVVIVLAAGLGGWGYMTSLRLQVGDLEPGAPELRQDSRYNKDNAFIASKFGRSSDVFVVIVKTPNEGLSDPKTLMDIDRLEHKLKQLSVVQSTVSAATLARLGTSAIFEGNPKWMTISRVPTLTGQATFDLKTNSPELMNLDGNRGALIVFLTDHKAQTLHEVVKVAEDFAALHSTGDRQFLLAAGTAGIEAATNIAVSEANRTMLVMVYSAVLVLCLIAFRSWRAAVVAIVPLMLTSVLCEALMVYLGIGLKVATLPVVALGVGIGVDYALYLLSVQLNFQRAGLSLREAYKKALTFTGKMVALVGVTLAAGVVTWAWSSIKFQADMGILLMFMFLWNMVGALVLIPALSRFLLSDAYMSRHLGHRGETAKGETAKKEAASLAEVH